MYLLGVIGPCWGWIGRPVDGESGGASPNLLWDVERVYVESFPCEGMYWIPLPGMCSEKRLLLVRTMAVVSSGAVLGIYQLLLELAAGETGTSGQTTITSRSAAGM